MDFDDGDFDSCQIQADEEVGDTEQRFLNSAKRGLKNKKRRAS